MAIRYSGDVEVRVTSLRKGLYLAKVRAPGEHATLEIRRRFLFRDANDPKAYDAIAEEAISEVVKQIGPLPVEFDDSGDIFIRRVFQAPCPTDDWD